MKFPYPKLVLASLFSVVFLSGCAQSEVFSPPVNGESMYFTATIPDELEAQPLSAMYRSEICRKERRNSSMESYTVLGFHSESYPLSIRQLNQVEVNIPKEGGGKCDWKLSNITFEVKLKDPSKIDALISKNFGAEATFVIDNNAPQVFDGGFEKKSGDINETLILFPLISERFIGGHVKQFWLIAKYETLTYKLKNTRNINVIVDYKSDMKSYWVGAKKKGEDSFLKYPNGNIILNSEIEPEYKKLMQILEAQSTER